MKDVIAIDPSWSAAVFQDYYILPGKTGLYPDRLYVHKDAAGAVAPYFETNSWGLKGQNLPEGKKAAVIWGDSVVFGSGASWPCLLNTLQSDYHFMNGGIEGDTPFNILTRMQAMNARYPLALNIFMPGWHAMDSWGRKVRDIFRRDEYEKALRAVLETPPSQLVLMTLPSYLSAQDALADISSLFCAGDDTQAFGFWGVLDYSPEQAALVRAFIMDRNEVTRRAAAAYKRPVIDLFNMLSCAHVTDARPWFYDVCHIRPAKYRELAQAVFSQLRLQGVL